MAPARFAARRILACGLGVALSLAESQRAQACSFSTNEHQLDEAEKAIDVTAPGRPTVGTVSIKRGRGPSQVGCRTGASSCDDIGSIALVVSATDDRTPASAMGYRVTISRGKAPDLVPSGGDLRASDGHIWLRWLDGASDDQEDLNFDLQIRAVDLAGNVSADFATATVRQETGGCSVGRGSRTAGGGVGVVVVAVSAWAAMRRRRRMPPQSPRA